MIRQIFWKPDVLIVVEPTFFCVPFSLMVAKLSRAKSWLHIQDLEIDAGFIIGLLSGKILHSLVKHIERFIMKQFDRVSSISGKMLERLINDKIPSEKCVLFPNWVDIEKICPLGECDFFRKEWGVKDD